jgi:hypothetical protein
MTSKFEQLIEYVINDEEAKAKELFHDIVVEKSREIYENLMQEEAEEIEEDADEELDEGIDDMSEMGGDSAQNLMREVEVEEEGMYEEEDEEVEIDGGMNSSEGGDDNLEDRVVDLEDKLDELMAEFEAMMDGDDEAQGDGDMMGPDEGGDAIEMDDTEEMDMMEAISLKAAPKPTTSEEGSVNTKGTVAANSGARGAMARPVSAAGGEEKGRTAPTAKDVGTTPTQDAGSKAFKTAAPKSVTAQAAGTNARTPFPRG